MIISENPRFILFSMEKTGTSSMDEALSSYFDQPKYRIRLDQTLPLLKRIRSKLERLARYHGKQLPADCWNDEPGLKHCSPHWLFQQRRVLFTEDNWDVYFKACFIRNPLDRLLSVYSFHTQKIPHLYPEARAAGSFRSWLASGGTGSARKSMKAFVTDAAGQVLPDFIGRYEFLCTDWSQFLERAGLEPVVLPQVSTTRTNHADWREVWNDELLEIFLANNVWKADMEFFGYDTNL